MYSQRPKSPAMGARDFLDRYAPNVSITQKDDLQRMVTKAVREYMDTCALKEKQHKQAMYATASQPTIRQSIVPRQVPTTTFDCRPSSAAPEQHPTFQDGGPQSEPSATPAQPATGSKDQENDWMNWRSSTPFTVTDRQLQEFRHFQNPKKPLPLFVPLIKGSVPRPPAFTRPQTAPCTSYGGDTTARTLPGRSVNVTSEDQTRSVQRPVSAKSPCPYKASVIDSGRDRAFTTVPQSYATPREEQTLRTVRDPNTKQAYVPELHAWINDAAPEERQIAYSVMKLLREGKHQGLEGFSPYTRHVDPMIQQPTNVTVHCNAAYRPVSEAGCQTNQFQFMKNKGVSHRSEDKGYYLDAKMNDIRQRSIRDRERSFQRFDKRAATAVPPFRTRLTQSKKWTYETSRPGTGFSTRSSVY